jgi:hypothetical protein
MNKRIFLATIVALFTIGLCTAPLFAVTIPFTITYYSDASHTIQVGVCSYRNCDQWASTGEMTCTGSTSDYWVYSNFHTCQPPK